jgi:hypothetical protein
MCSTSGTSTSVLRQKNSGLFLEELRFSAWFLCFPWCHEIQFSIVFFGPTRVILRFYEQKLPTGSVPYCVLRTSLQQAASRVAPRMIRRVRVRIIKSVAFQMKVKARAAGSLASQKDLFSTPRARHTTLGQSFKFTHYFRPCYVLLPYSSYPPSSLEPLWLTMPLLADMLPFICRLRSVTSTWS